MARNSSRQLPAAGADRTWPRRCFHCYLLALLVLFVLSVLGELPYLQTTARAGGPGFWLLVALAIVADTPRLWRQGRRSSLPVLTSVTFCYALSYGWGHGTARITQAVAILVASGLAGRSPWAITYDIGRYGLPLWTASETLTAIGRPAPVGPGPVALIGVLAGAVMWYVTFRLLTAIGTWLEEGASWTTALWRGVPAEAASAAALLLLSPMLVLLAKAGVWLIPLILAPVFAVSQMAHYYDRLQRRALQDPQTGLPNRLALLRAAQAPIEHCVQRRAEAGITAMLVVDIVALGRVNEALGHRIGDEVVIACAERIGSRAGPCSAVARLQSDEFGILVWGLAATSEALAYARTARAQFDEPVTVDGQPLSVSVSIGIALCPEHGTSYDDLERRADTAMEQAKALPERIAVFQASADAPTADQISLLGDLRRAIEEPEDGQILPFYQPQVDLSTGEVVGFEALLRWRHPTRGMVGPDQVMRVAEYSPFMRKLSMTMLEQVLAQLAAWRAQGWSLPASVNVSARDMHSADLVVWLEGRLRHYGIAPSQLQLEITENAVTSQLELVIDSLQQLRRIGVGASLDDFGTGFSSLQHLRRLPLTEVKIDRGFVQSVVRSPRDDAIVRAVVDLGREMGIRVVAEGVEDDETRRRLLADGCRVAQGWYYSAPLPADDFAQWCSPRRAHT